MYTIRSSPAAATPFPLSHGESAWSMPLWEGWVLLAHPPLVGIRMSHITTWLYSVTTNVEGESHARADAGCELRQLRTPSPVVASQNEREPLSCCMTATCSPEGLSVC